MGTARHLALVHLRRRARSTVGLVLLVGLGTAVVMASTAGARRTASAFPRMVTALDSEEILLSPNGDGTGTQGFYDDVAELDGVTAVAPLVGLAMAFHPDSVHAGIELAGSFGALDDKAARTVGRPKLLDGRLPDPDSPDQVLVNRFLAEEGIGVGDRLRLVFVDSESFETNLPVPEGGRELDATVVGVGVWPNEVVPFTDLDEFPWISHGPGVTALAPPESTQFEGALVDTEPGTDVDELRAAISSLAEQHTGTLGEAGVFTNDQAALADDVQGSIRPLAVALGAFAAVTAIVVAVVVGQAVRRHLWVPDADRRSLAALGLTRRDMAIRRALTAAALALASGAVAVVASIAVSNRFPIGPARLAEPAPGIDVDVVVILAGPVVLAAVLGASALLAAESGGSRRRARVSLPASSVPSASLGLRAAFGGAAGTAAPATFVGSVVAVAALVAAGTFTASLDGLVGTPERFGQGWSDLLDAQFGPAEMRPIMDELDDHPSVNSIAAGTYGQLEVEGESVAAISWLPLRGGLAPVVLEGDHADEPGEVALGGEVMDRLDVSIGDRIEADAGTGARQFEVVGEVVFAEFSLGSFATTGLGEGAQLHPDDLRAIGLPDPGDPLSELEPLGPEYYFDGRLFNFVAVETTGVDDAALEPVFQSFADEDAVIFRREVQRPITISDLGRVRTVPGALAATLAALALATLANTLGGSLRRRRKELGILKSLGFVRYQIGATVLWHATAVGVVALVVGVPLGLAVGRVAWTSFARQIYVPDVAVMPALLVVGVVAGTIVLVDAVAAPAARMAARTRASDVLKAE